MNIRREIILELYAEIEKAEKELYELDKTDKYYDLYKYKCFGIMSGLRIAQSIVNEIFEKSKVNE